jgi:outer membrane protein OmpA-like peptidoglycan-associated protein/tetratricopeptide (TPR) repeat protein
MSKTRLILLFLSFGFSVTSQTMEKAITYFDRYEYSMAYISFKEAGVNQMDSDELLKYIYSCYVIGDFEEVCRHAEKVASQEELDSFFLWAFGQSFLATGQKQKAKENYLHYKELIEIDHDFVDLRLQTLAEINLWDMETFITNTNVFSNSTKGDVSGFRSAYGTIKYIEIGLDSAKSILPKAQIENAELLLLKPRIMSRESTKSMQITLPDSLILASVNSISFVPDSDNVFLSYSEPAHNNEINYAPHIYVGKFDATVNRISDIQKWEFSGLEDSSSCAHVSINSLGTRMVFSKKKRQSQHADIYISEKTGNSWGEPRPLNVVNTKWNEVFPVFQQDGSLCFSSNGRKGYGKLDVYTYSFESDQIKHLKAPINGPMDDFNYYEDSLLLGAEYTSNRFNGVGDDDIYRIIYDSVSTELIVAENATMQKRSEFVNISQTLHFHFDEDEPIETVIIDTALVLLLKNDSGLKIHLDCHADERGSDLYNQELSESRGKNVRKQLMSIGIQEDKIEINALGESSPVIHCDDCDKKEHAGNRVVIFSIQKTDPKDAL